MLDSPLAGGNCYQLSPRPRSRSVGVVDAGKLRPEISSRLGRPVNVAQLYGVGTLGRPHVSFVRKYGVVWLESSQFDKRSHAAENHNAAY